MGIRAIDLKNLMTDRLIGNLEQIKHTNVSPLHDNKVIRNWIQDDEFCFSNGWKIDGDNWFY
jgi:hypothetical protein